MLSRISALAGRKDCFVALEKVLWENVGVLVPAVMSFVDWAKALQNLRDANNTEQRQNGTIVEDPLKEIRDFLGTTERTQ